MSSAAPPARPPSWAPVVVALVVLLALVLPNPAGYVGAGGDDFYYVRAARCAAEHGWCLPHTHWATRWPLVAPMGAAFALLGDGPRQAALVPLLYSLAALGLFVRLVQQLWGRRAALVGGIALAATAAFAKGLLQPNVETVELAWLLAAASAAHAAVRADNRGLALLAGLYFAVAIQARMTSLLWLPIGAIALVVQPYRPWRLLVAFVAGLALPLATEALLYARMAGDPLLGFHLSAAHTRIESSELSPGLDPSRSPLFNPDLIAGWHPVMGLHVHWLIDGLLNLVANPQIGWTLVAAALLLLLNRAQLRRGDPACWLAGAAILYTGGIVYALALDPKARMFLPVTALAAALIGRLGTMGRDRGERLVAIAVLTVLVGIGAIETAKRYDLGQSRHLAAAWARAHPGQVAIDDDTRRSLTFDATVRALPVAPQAALPRLIVQVAAPCGARPGWTLLRSADFGRPHDPLMLCEFTRVSANPAVRPRR